MPDIRADGRFQVIQDVGEPGNVGSETGGWLLGDEIDMTVPTRCARPPLRTASRTRYQTTGADFANYGKGHASASPLTARAAPTTRQLSGEHGLGTAHRRGASSYWFYRSYDGPGTATGYQLRRERQESASLDSLTAGGSRSGSSSRPVGRSRERGSRCARASTPPTAVGGVALHHRRGAGGSSTSSTRSGADAATITRPVRLQRARAHGDRVDAQIKSLATVLNSPTVTVGLHRDRRREAHGQVGRLQLLRVRGRAPRCRTR